MKPARPRRYLHPVLIGVLRPAFRYSESRDAYVLRVGGQRFGPVLRPSTAEPQQREIPGL